MLTTQYKNGWPQKSPLVYAAAVILGLILGMILGINLALNFRLIEIC